MNGLTIQIIMHPLKFLLPAKIYILSGFSWISLRTYIAWKGPSNEPDFVISYYRFVIVGTSYWIQRILDFCLVFADTFVFENLLKHRGVTIPSSRFRWESIFEYEYVREYNIRSPWWPNCLNNSENLVRWTVPLIYRYVGKKLTIFTIRAALWWNCRT